MEPEPLGPVARGISDILPWHREVTLVGLWVVFMLIMPVLINTLATTIHPVPSRSVWITAQRAFEQEANARRASLVERYTIEYPEEIAPSELPAHMRTWSERVPL